MKVHRDHFTQSRHPITIPPTTLMIGPIRNCDTRCIQSRRAFIGGRMCQHNIAFAESSKKRKKSKSAVPLAGLFGNLLSLALFVLDMDRQGQALISIESNKEELIETMHEPYILSLCMASKQAVTSGRMWLVYLGYLKVYGGVVQRQPRVFKGHRKKNTYIS